MSIKSKDMTMEERGSRIAELVKQFKEGEAFYLSKDFVESEVRSKFIDPFLECLKWDVKNEKGARPDKREVITEDRIVVDGKTKHPDYTLCCAGVKKLYVEAKQPSVDLKTNPEPALQVRRYAYTAKMPIAILTDFQELAIYDTRIKPTEKDTAATARIEYLTYEQYEEKFEELYRHISWDAVDLGHFDSYYEGAKEKRGTATVDEDILEMIERWRVLLAEDIALHNEEMNETALTSCVQKLIDRILFLRIAEDKEIEPPKTLLKICGCLRCYRDKNNTQRTASTPPFIFASVPSSHSTYFQNNIIYTTKDNAVYSALKSLFLEADSRFNAGLFKNDDALNSLQILDKTLTTIITELYYPASQYEFSVLPVEILGSIYERFLGKVIRFKRRTKNGHSVEIIEKLEVQKAGGVYYTPSYIVDYIVRQTIGKKIEKATPEKVSSLKICDPSCGSGSFLVGAYQYLLDWHFDYYYAEERRVSSEKKGLIYKDARTHEYKLSIEEKRRILLNNIYGVDIDGQAVEVTKLSLFLKLLENEGKALSKDGQASLFRASEIKKILPELKGNIKCGNSLIGSDYYDDKNLSLLEITEQRRVNAFDWETEFKCIFEAGGFDCVIGNPPYLRVQGLHENYKEEVKFYEEKYKSATGRFDFYVLFMERGFKLLNNDGLLSFILPHKFINSDFGVGVREWIYKNKALNFIAHFDSASVFAKAKVYTCIIGLSHNNREFKFGKTKPTDLSSIEFESFPIENLSNTERWSFQSYKKTQIIEKLKFQALRLKDIVQYCSQGTVSMGDDIYIMNGHFEGEYFIGFSERLKKEVKLEKEIMKPLLKGTDVKRYKKAQNSCYLIYPHHLVEDKTQSYELAQMKTMFPLCFEYLSNFKKELILKKERYKTNPTYWYALHCSRQITMFEEEKIVTPEISLGCNMSYDKEKLYHNTKCYTIILKKEEKHNTLAYLAILNSTLMWFFLKETGYVLRGGFFCFKTKYLEPFPIPKLSEEKSKILTELVSQMLEAHNQLELAKFENDKKFLTQRIEILDKQINTIVYALYGLSEEEIKIVES